MRGVLGRVDIITGTLERALGGAMERLHLGPQSRHAASA
jgi:hypothetical protein